MLQPKIGLSMLYMLSEPFTKMTKQLETAPTQYIEVVDDGTHQLNRKRVAALNEAAKSFNLHYSVHAPFTDLNVASISKPIRDASMKRLKRSMKFASDLDAYLWILHPGSRSSLADFYPKADWKQNLQSITSLNENASELGMRVAMENLPAKYMFLMKTPQDFQQFYTETGLTDIGIVLDTGHANLEGQIEQFLQQLPDKIFHIHVSDNHGVIDEHLGLGHGKIDWQAFAHKVKVTGFSGTVLAESAHDVEETVQRLKQLFV
jgi:sugar phosphate isomerase/epimerase